MPAVEIASVLASFPRKRESMYKQSATLRKDGSPPSRGRRRSYGKSPPLLTLSLSPQAHLGELASQRGRILRLGERTLERSAAGSSSVPSPPSASACGCGSKRCKPAKAACLRGEGQDQRGSVKHPAASGILQGPRALSASEWRHLLYCRFPAMPRKVSRRHAVCDPANSPDNTRRWRAAAIQMSPRRRPFAREPYPPYPRSKLP